MVYQCHLRVKREGEGRIAKESSHGASVRERDDEDDEVIRLQFDNAATPVNKHQATLTTYGHTARPWTIDEELRLKVLYQHPASSNRSNDKGEGRMAKESSMQARDLFMEALSWSVLAMINVAPQLAPQASDYADDLLVYR